MDAQMLRGFALFATLPDEEIQVLADSFAVVDYPQGDVLVQEGTRTEKVFLLVEGEVDIYKALGTGDERLIATREKGVTLGEMSLFTDRRTHTASVVARTPVRMLVMSLIQFDALIRRHPALVYGMLRIVSRRLDESENLVIADLREKNRQLTVAYEELKAAQAELIVKEKLEHELQIASRIQRSILPRSVPTHPGLDFGALMIPARQVGGDFYDFIPLANDRVGIVVGDVCDKGMPAALFMALTYSALRSEVSQHLDPGDALRALNQQLGQINASNMYVTLLYGVLDLHSGRFRYARAGHPYPLLLDAYSSVVALPAGRGQPVGMFRQVALDEQECTIPPGGTLLIYSDGLSETIEAMDPPLELDELAHSLLAEGPCSAQALCERLWRAAGGTEGQSLLPDDFTVVAVRREE